MSLEVVVYVLTALAAVVVVLTRLRLGGEQGAGRTRTSPALLNVHTGAGALGLLLWVVLLVADRDSALGGPLFGILALGLLWLTALVGLLLLARWLPTRGRHAGEGGRDSWSEGPWLSLLAHVGMAVGVLVFTAAYLADRV